LFVTHDTSIKRSSRAPVVEVCFEVQARPLNVVMVLGLPGNPLAPTATQNLVVTHETL
jgi:hypothetical protein